MYPAAKPKMTFSHPLCLTNGDVSFNRRSAAVQSFPETLRVLAVMTEFQPDSDPRTTGKGQFDTSSSGAEEIDSPPHNKQYFQSHLLFLENYFRRVSKGKIVVKWNILDSIYILPHSMQYYSPPRSSSMNVELGQLMVDTWHRVDSLTHGSFPFQDYGLFTIFHAGVGRDIDQSSCLGYEPTPYDIPSIYLNLVGLQKMPAEFRLGVSVNGGSFHITNSMIIPETETRDNLCTFPATPLRLGINGLLAASVGSHLGLPDLFDTKTGASGIGRFGLMDGQSIFSWDGVFPPEPSAWERYFLGWVDPITISSGDSTYSLPAASLGGSVDTVYRVLISEKEYFLVENRNRDANRDGATVTMIMNGDTTRKSWVHDTVGFNPFNLDSLFGVVADVDEFDWSLPGGVFAWFDGGILIWHVDENVIEVNIADDAVNANPDRRGVNLMEADGSQDIGQSYGLLDAGFGSDAGWQYDYWYDGNDRLLRRQSNALTPTSYPSSLSNDHANSHIYISNFSVRGPRMSARIKAGDEQVAALPGFPKAAGYQFGKNSITAVNASNSGMPSILVATNQYPAGLPPSPDNSPSFQAGQAKIFGWNVDGSLLIPTGDPTGLLATSGGQVRTFVGKLAVANFIAGQTTDLTIGANDSSLGQGVSSVKAWTLQDQDNDHQIDTLFQRNLFRRVTTSAVVSDSFVVYGASHGTVYVLRLDGSLYDSVQIAQSDTSDIMSITLFQNPGEFIAVTSNGSVIPYGVACAQLSATLPLTQSSSKPSFAIVGTLSTSRKQILLASRDGQVTLANLCSIPTAPAVATLTFSTGGEILNTPALADIDGDGTKDIIVFSGNKIWAINATGAVLENFPITVMSNKTILTSPIVADLDGSGTPDIVAVTQEGLVVAYDKTGNMVRGFPLLTGANGGSTPAAFYMPGTAPDTVDIGLAVASDDGHVYAWETGWIRGTMATAPAMPWPQYLHDAQNRGLVEDLLTPRPLSTEYLPASRAYNWPNPVDAAHGYKTHIRYFVSEDSRVHIKVFDLAGDFVTEFDGPGQGGLDNEVEWNVTGIQSGVYFAHVEAQGTTEHGVAVIKVAVIK